MRTTRAQRGVSRVWLAAGTLLLLGLAAASVLAQGAWTNGQDALYVIGQPDFVSKSSGCSATTLSYPTGLALDLAHGQLYLADRSNGRVLRFEYPLTGNQPAAELVFGRPDLACSAGGGSDGQNTFRGVNGLAVDSTGRLWVADAGYDGNRVVWFDDAYAISSNQPDADGVLGQAGFDSYGAACTRDGMGDPAAVAVDSAGTLWVADKGSSRVLRFDDAAAKSNGANADGVLGQPDFTTCSGDTAQNRMSWPIAVAAQGSTLWVADQSNRRVLRFDDAAAKSDGANADGVLGQDDFTSTDAGTTQSRFKLPSGVAVDGYGRLYVADAYDSHRVLIFNDAVNLADGSPADNVLGKPNFTASGWTDPTTRAALNLDTWHVGLALNQTERLLVSDTLDHRVLLFESGEPSEPTEPAAVGGVGVSAADRAQPAASGGLWPVSALAAAAVLLLLGWRAASAAIRRRRS